MSDNRMRNLLNKGGKSNEIKFRALFQSLPFQLCELLVLDDSSYDENSAKFHCRYFFLRNSTENHLYGTSHANNSLNIIDPSHKASWAALKMIFQVSVFPVVDVLERNQFGFSIYDNALREPTDNLFLLQKEYEKSLIRDPIRNIFGIRDLILIRLPESDGSVAGVIRLINQITKTNTATTLNSFPYLDIIYGRWIELFTSDISNVMETLPDRNLGVDEFPIRSRNPKFKEQFRLIQIATNSDCSVLIEGESGTGKEHIVKYIHRNSQRFNKKLLAINCGAIPDELIESELFGHKKGAFTGAIAEKDGLFKIADGGILFLDEIGELPFPKQVKLLRAIETQEFLPVGEVNTIKTNVRIIAATNKNLETMVQEGKFRKDLFYRINTLYIYLPRLCDRREDIQDLIDSLLNNYARKNKKIPQFPIEVRQQLAERPWHGNIRELASSLELLCDSCKNNGFVSGSDLFLINSKYGLSDLTSSIRTIIDVAYQYANRGNWDTKKIIDFITMIAVGTTNELENNLTNTASKLGIAWNTAKKYVEEFENLKFSLNLETKNDF